MKRFHTRFWRRGRDVWNRRLLNVTVPYNLR